MFHGSKSSLLIALLPFALRFAASYTPIAKPQLRPLAFRTRTSALHVSKTSTSDDLDDGIATSSSKAKSKESHVKKTADGHTLEYFSEQVEKHFPGAMPGAKTLQAIKPVMEQLGMTPTNTLFAQSVCPDEINHEAGDITNLFAEYMGEVFHLGGLGGLPFTGKTGFGAYSNHVPDSGHCFVLMAPHIGLSDESKFGQYSRDGQSCPGAACGAAVGALAHCCSGKPLPVISESLDDEQMAFLIHEISKRKDSIVDTQDENTKQANLAKANYEIANEMLQNIVNVDFGDEDSSLAVLTGIQINMPRPFEDFFQPLSFAIHRKDGTVTDLFEETFNEEALRVAEIGLQNEISDAIQGTMAAERDQAKEDDVSDEVSP